MKNNKMLKRILLILGILVLVLIIIIFSINGYVKASTKNQILTKDEYLNLKDIDCAIILGAGIWGERPSPMLEDRLQVGIELYQNGVVPKIIMTGDHGRIEYDEVNVMKDYGVNKGVPSEDIFMDHAGFSTYESIYRAKEIFEAKNVIIVTQEYHLHRALYIANKLGIKAYGVASDPRQYVGAFYREVREILARNKDVIQCIFKPEPTFLGESIPVFGNGNVTNDKLNNQTNVEKGMIIIERNKIVNIYLLDEFIDNTNIYNESRKSDKIEILSYTIEGDEILTTVEYVKEENKITLTKDNTKDEFAGEEGRKIIVKEFEFPKYRLAKLVDGEYIKLVLMSDNEIYNISRYNKKLENEKDTSRIKVKEASLKSKGTSTEELVFYNGVLYGKSFALIDYAPNPDGPIDVINKLIGNEYIPTTDRETNVESLLNCYVDSIGGSSLILKINNVYSLYTALDYKE